MGEKGVQNSPESEAYGKEGTMASTQTNCATSFCFRRLSTTNIESRPFFKYKFVRFASASGTVDKQEIFSENWLTEEKSKMRVEATDGVACQRPIWPAMKYKAQIPCDDGPFEPVVL